MIANHEQDHAVVHFAAAVLNMLSIAPMFVFFLGGGVHNSELAWLVPVSVLSWLPLLMLCLVLVVISHPHRRVALAGMLITFGLYSFLALPAVT